MNYNELAKTIHAQNVAVGWWDTPNPCIFEKLQLVVTEISEATEGERKNLMDDHLPHRKMGEVELADAMIRLLDLGGYMNWMYKHNAISIGQLIEDVESTTNLANKHFWLSTVVCGLGLTVKDGGNISHLVYSDALDLIKYVSNRLDYDIESAMHEKIEYNKTRADHKRENRAATNGKAF